ncbi:hypothetical protein BGZ94_006780, partial [Podila epigama]
MRLTKEYEQARTSEDEKKDELEEQEEGESWGKTLGQLNVVDATAANVCLSWEEIRAIFEEDCDDRAMQDWSRQLEYESQVESGDQSLYESGTESTFDSEEDDESSSQSFW